MPFSRRCSRSVENPTVSGFAGVIAASRACAELTVTSAANTIIWNALRRDDVVRTVVPRQCLFGVRHTASSTAGDTVYKKTSRAGSDCGSGFVKSARGSIALAPSRSCASVLAQVVSHGGSKFNEATALRAAVLVLEIAARTHFRHRATAHR